ncbi:MAG: tyrosine-type recombinase/integrase [Candidatus Micrarchaeota archaeon]|nr:tyrosine-type recombinase/integrase [Candidatus Micrarchaeota archaeon]
MELADALRYFKGYKKETASGQSSITVNLSKSNYKAVEDFTQFLIASGKNRKTILRHLYCLRIFTQLYGEKKDYKSATRADIQSAILKVETGDYAENTKLKIRITTKYFYKYLMGSIEDNYYPKQVSWIKTFLPSNHKRILPEDILTPEEVLKLIDASKYTRDRAIIALLYDSGIRVGELMHLRVKDINLEGSLGHIMVGNKEYKGKTGMRKVGIMMSVPYLVNYLEENKYLKPDDNLWRALGNNREEEKNGVVKGASIRRMLQRLSKEAKINKPVHPHAFRHARASNYANQLTEQQLKKHFGWTQSSKMAAVYVHLNDKDMDEAVMRANGVNPQKEVNTPPKLPYKECQRCKNQNKLTAVHCDRCGAPLDTYIAISDDEKINKLGEMFAAASQDPRWLAKLLKSAQKYKKK